MAILADRPNTALLVIDVQNGVLEGAARRDEVVANVGELVERARGAGVSVVWVQHADDEELLIDSIPWQLAPELGRRGGEPIVHKRHGDAFEGTDLEAALAERRVGRLVVAGAQSDMCIRSTLHGALVRGYDALLVADAHTTVDLTSFGAPPPEQVIAHTNLYWSWQTAPGRQAGILATAEVAFDGAEDRRAD